MTALVERLRAATGPDRILDAELASNLMGWCLHPSTVRSGYNDDTGWTCEVCGADTWGNVGPSGQKYRDPVPELTASIDAATALVDRCLPGWRWGISCHYVKDGKNEQGWPLHSDGFRAHVTERSALRSMPFIADAKTAPLALLLALLTALSEPNHE